MGAQITDWGRRAQFALIAVAVLVAAIFGGILFNLGREVASFSAELKAAQEVNKTSFAKLEGTSKASLAAIEATSKANLEHQANAIDKLDSAVEILVLANKKLSATVEKFPPLHAAFRIVEGTLVDAKANLVTLTNENGHMQKISIPPTVSVVFG